MVGSEFSNIQDVVSSVIPAAWPEAPSPGFSLISGRIIKLKVIHIEGE